jgi:hypothetical protein
MLAGRKNDGKRMIQIFSFSCDDSIVSFKFTADDGSKILLSYCSIGSLYRFRQLQKLPYLF